MVICGAWFIGGWWLGLNRPDQDRKDEPDQDRQIQKGCGFHGVGGQDEFGGWVVAWFGPG